MRGLILAGIGKGLADAGETFGTAMMQDMREKRADERQAARDKAMLEKQAALEELREKNKAARDEREAKLRMEQATKASTMADEAAAARDVGAFTKLAASSQAAGEQGDVALPESVLRDLVKKDPALGKQYRGMGLIDANMPLTRNEARLQRAEDEFAAATKIGAHSTVLESLDKRRQRVLDEIKEENKEERERRRGDQQDRRLDLLEERIASQNRTDATNARANETRANRPASGGGAGESVTLRGLQAEATAAARAVDAARKDRDAQQKAVANSYGEARTAAQEALKSANERLREAEKKANTATDALSAYNSGRSRPAAAASSPRPAASTPSNNASAPARPPLSSFVRQ